MCEPTETLLSAAWAVRENAFVIGPTKVGCAVLSTDGRIFVGCNVEHRFRSHDVHAEVNAITSMVTAGGLQISMVAIAAEREQFTPCGACMDWIFQFADPDKCEVICQANLAGPVVRYGLKDLMPFYPK